MGYFLHQGHSVKLFPVAASDHDDAAWLTVLFSVLVQSLMGRAPESMGEETVQSKEAESVMVFGSESMTSEVAESSEG